LRHFTRHASGSKDNIMSDIMRMTQTVSTLCPYYI